MDKIEQVLGIGRNKMVALALLCGCDYSDGVNGIGKEAALKLFKTLSDEEVLERYFFFNFRKYFHLITLLLQLRMSSFRLLYTKS